KAQVVEEAKEASRFTTPKPGAKPKPASGRPVVNPSKVTDTARDATGGGSAATPGAGSGSSGNGGVSMSKPPGNKPPGNKPPGNKPAPGAKPRGGPKKKR
ncbi:MAG TPA: hypothetical protein VIU11_26745, partial [Nakamurella sp.]